MNSDFNSGEIMQEPNQDIENGIQKTAEISKKENSQIFLLKNMGKYTVVIMLVSGKIIASAALLQQNIQGTLSHLKVQSDIAFAISAASGYSNAVSNGITRSTSIYNKLFNPEPDSIKEENLTSLQ